MAGYVSKRPAPVLPAMGLHSFHNDSPPFAAASAAEIPEPETVNLDPPHRVRPLQPPRTTSHAADMEMDCEIATPTASMPILQRGFDASPLRADGAGRQRIPTSSEDEVLSTSRSRILLSGYMFGGPPSPENGTTGINRELDRREDKGITAGRGPTRRSSPDDGGGDSPPLADRPTAPSSPRQNDVQAQTLASMMDASLSAGPRRQGQGRRGSKGADSGYEALLNGLNDGEADLDESAPKADWETERFLRGEGGEEGKYRFPRHRLRRTMKDESKIPLVIVACGSFSPPTYLHLRMFEMAKDEIVESQTYEIMAGYYSPVSSYYKKSGLAPAIHRVRMCELAVEHTSTWLMVDPWEAGQPEYKRTAVVLDHFDEMLNENGGCLEMSDGKKRRYKIMLLAGGDLIESFGEPGVWSSPDLHIILGRFGCLIIERAGSDVWAFLLSHDILYHHRRNVIVIKQLIYNDISSTKVRLFVRRGMSIKYLLPNSVIQYIYDNKLYRESDHKAIMDSAA